MRHSAMDQFVTVCGIVSIMTATAVGGGLISNPGFEQAEAEGGLAESWIPTYWSNPHGSVTLSPQARTGEWCVRITGVPPEQITDATPRNNNLVAQRVGPPPVRGVRKLTLKVWFKSSANAKAFCSIMTLDTEGNRLQYISSPGHTDVADWTQLVLPVSTARETAQLTVYLRNDGEGAVWYDDVSLTAADDVLENDILRVHVEPLIGGRLRSLVIKRRDRDVTIWEGVRPGGMAADIVPGDMYPGMLRDAACSAEVLEKGRCVRVTHGPLAAPFDGLEVQKEFELHATLPRVDVRLRVSNRAETPRRISLRAQQCLAPRQAVITVPMAGQLRVLRHQEGLAKWGLDLNDLNAGWIACSDPESNDAVLFLFDPDEVTKGYLYRNQNVQTVEWYYRDVEVAPGAAWTTQYTIAVLDNGFPVVAVSDAVAAGLSTLSVDAGARRALAVSALRDADMARIVAAPEADPPLRDIERDVSLSAGEATVVELSWQGAELKTIALSVQADGESAAATVGPAFVDASPLMDLPPPPEFHAEFPAATSFFPYGEYFRGYVKGAGGNQLDHVRRQLRAYRRCYMNTYMSSESGMLSNFRKSGTVPLLEEVRKRRMRVIPRADMMRRFERDKDRRIIRELPPEPPTRETILARLERGGFTLDVRREFVRTYGDLILAYDFADEPQGQYIPNYMMLQSVYRDVDPGHPILVILNLNRTEFLPFMPIYYGDEYPVRNAKRGGRNPWAVTKMVRFCATHTKAPVWVMLQAFGGLPDYTWQLPDEAEMRLTIYEAVANGAKGLTFHGSSSPPCWRYRLYYFDTARDSWGVEAPAWAAMRDAGRQVTAIGQELLLTDVSDADVVAIDCDVMTDEDVPYRGPAIKAGILRRREGDGWFAVVVNQDVVQPRRGTLSLNAGVVSEDCRLCDLHSLTEPAGDPRAVTECGLELEPGDGRIFFIGPASAAGDVVSAVHKGHCDNELPLFEIGLEAAKANECDTTRVEAFAVEAGRAYAAAHYPTARAKFAAARKALRAGVGAAATLARAQDSLADTLRMLTAVVLTYRRHFDVIVPPASRKEAAKGALWRNEQDAAMQAYVDETAEALCLRMALADKVQAGRAEQALPEIMRLQKTAGRLEAEAIPYVLARVRELAPEEPER